MACHQPMAPTARPRLRTWILLRASPRGEVAPKRLAEPPRSAIFVVSSAVLDLMLAPSSASPRPYQRSHRPLPRRLPGNLRGEARSRSPTRDRRGDQATICRDVPRHLTLTRHGSRPGRPTTAIAGASVGWVHALRERIEAAGQRLRLGRCAGRRRLVPSSQRPSPRSRCPKTARNRSRSAAGSAPRSIAATFSARCAGSKVPVNTVETPGCPTT